MASRLTFNEGKDSMTTIWLFAWAAFAVAQAADIFSTNRLLSKGGRELNPVMRFLMDRLGDKWWVGKLLMAGAAGTLLHVSNIPELAFALATILLLIAANNWRLSNKQ